MAAQLLRGNEFPLRLNTEHAWLVQHSMSRLPQLKQRAPLAGALFLFALLGYASWVRLSEPRYQGKRVSVWFQEYCSLRLTSGGYSVNRGGRHIFVNNVEVPDPASEALVAMGEPAASYLGKQLSARNMLNVALYRRFYTNISVPFRSMLPDSYAAESKRIDAAMALVSFGSKAQKEIPAIVDLVIKQPGYPNLMLLSLLLYLDVPRSESERLVTALVQQGRYAHARQAVDGLKVRSPLIAGLVAEMLTKRDSADIWPFERLRECGSDAAVALPTLLQTINSTNAEVRYQTVRTLEAIGAGASNALPALQASSSDSSSMVRSAAKRAIASISATNSVPQ